MSVSVLFNDLWMFEIASGWWTWLSGNFVNQAGNYGTLGKTTMDNQPGARQWHSMAMHPTGPLIFVFGGHGVDTVDYGMHSYSEN